MMRSEDRRDDELPAIEVERRISQPGDLWSLARHKIICGNALDDADYRLLMDRKAQAVFIDPPYNVPIDGHVSGKGSIRHREFAMASGEMDEQAFTAFLTQACGHLARYSANVGSLHYICIDWRHLPELLAATRRVYREQTNLCVWVKDNPGMGSHYRSQHELIVLFKNGKKPHRNNVQLGQFGRNRTNVWHYPGTTHFGRRGEESDLLARHPTPKPVALIADALLDCSVRGGIVLDAFLGSGSTLIAAERVGRICRGIELDPVYVDLAIRRWERFTGGRAVHALTGKHFDELAREREACNG
jgi:DNA modification methylase